MPNTKTTDREAAKANRAARRNGGTVTIITNPTPTNTKKEAIVPTTTRTRTTAKTVKLDASHDGAEKLKSYQFTFKGTSKTPIVKAVYVSNDLLAKFESGVKSVVIPFEQYVPGERQKPQPKSAIRFTGSEDTIRDLYVNREVAVKAGFSEANAPVVTVKVTGDTEISLTFSQAK
jgi:hypothetical protein